MKVKFTKRRSRSLRNRLGAYLLAICCFGAAFIAAPSCVAQQPFVTDDAAVTEKGKLHFESSNEYDNLQKTLFPAEHQNTAIFKLSYGLVRNVELSVDGPLITLVNNPSASNSRFVIGNGDTNFTVKYNFRHERDKSILPALTVSASVEIPTGNAKKSLGSGVFDYGVNLIGQKTLGDKTVWRVNSGMLFAGNTATGVIGITTVRGVVFVEGTSIVRKINDRLQLGAEVTGAVTNNFTLSKGQLQVLAGGNYQLNEKTSLAFGVVRGRFTASPRFGAMIGLAYDF